MLVIPYTVTDEHGDSDSSTLTITVTGTNDAPVAVVDTAEVDEDLSISGSVATNDSDVDNGAVLSYALDDPAPAGLTFGDDGGWSFDASSYDSLAEDEELVLVIPYTVTDEHGDSDSSTLTITVTGTNDAPVAVVDTAEVDEDLSISGSVATNDSDVDDGAVLSYALDDPAPAGLTFGDDGGWSFDASSYDSLAEDEELVLVIPYTVTDEHGDSDSSTLTITVTGTNDAPVAVVDTAEVDEDLSISGSVATNDSDVDNGAVLSYALDDPAPAGLTFGDDGGWSFDASSYDSLAEDEELVLVIPYTVTDEHGDSDSSTLTITVTGTNDAPVAVVDEDTTSENEVLTVDVLANDTDVDNSAVLTVTAASAPAGQGTASVVANQVEFDPGLDFDHLAVGESVQVVVDYTIEDEHGASSSSTLTITVTGTNDEPVAVADLASTDEDTSVLIDVLANDDDPDASDVLAITGASVTTGLGTVTIESGQLRYNPGSAYNYLAAGESAEVVLSYTIDDGNGGTDTESVTVTINGLADEVVPPPVYMGDDDPNNFDDIFGCRCSGTIPDYRHRWR